MHKKFLATMLLAFAVIAGVAPYAVAASPQPVNAPAAGDLTLHPARRI